LICAARANVLFGNKQKMSYTPTAIDIDDFNADKPHHHHPVVASVSSWRYWIFGVLCFLLFFLFFFLFWGTWATTNSETQQAISRIKSQLTPSSKGFTTSGLYSVPAGFNQLSLCQMALYHGTTDSDGKNERLQMTDAREFTEQENYVIKTRFDMRFNVEPDQLDEKYFIVHYELASNYPFFSTIKLVESTLDIKTKNLIVKRELILCSNHPSSSERRCNRHTTLNDIIAMNNTRISPMDPVRRSDRKNASKTTKIEPANDMDMMDDDERHVQQLEEEISNLRLFHLNFYRESASTRDSYKEYLSLSVEPSQC
jgi:hypothetical protein